MADRDALRARLLDFMAQPGFTPLRKRALARKLDVSDAEYVDFRHFVDELVERGVLAELKHGKFGLPRHVPAGRHAATAAADVAKIPAAQLKDLPRHAVTGRIDIKRGGFGFLLSDPPGSDLFIGAEDLGGALSGDLVAVLLKRSRHGRRNAGRVARILERAHSLIVGTFHAYARTRRTPAEGPGGFVTPDTRGLFEEVGILPGHQGEAQEGDKVALELVEPDQTFRPGARPTGRISRVYGEAGETRAELEAILQNFNLRTEYPPEVLAQAEAIPEQIPAPELARRADRTEPLTFTIDPEDAKDHDDAVALRALPGGRTELLVHIADVSHYVPEDSPVDLEARRRGTSAYLPGLTLPMLPQKLSNNLCSLREGELRLTKTVSIVFSKNLFPEATRIEQSFIRSAGRLTYDQVRDALEKEDPKRLPSPEVYEALRQMRGFAASLRRKRLEAGSIDLDFPEVRLRLNPHGDLVGWEKEEHHWAHQLIEDMMLAANRAVAEFLVESEIPGLFRVHEDPDEDALAQFAEFLQAFGLALRPPYDRHKLKGVLQRVRGKEYEHAVQLALLTSLKQARYSAECYPHYALSFSRYLHFTSPIRRYPDLIVHRALDGRFAPGEKALPAPGKKPGGGDERREFYRRVAFLRPLAIHCSQRERAADAAEEEYKKVRQIQYLKHHLRASHPGIITRVTPQGLVVEMQDCYVEGFVRAQDLDDDAYEYYPDRHLIQGRRKQRSFRLGDKVTVRVVHIDIGARRVGLVFVNA